MVISYFVSGKHSMVYCHHQKLEAWKTLL